MDKDICKKKAATKKRNHPASFFVRKKYLQIQTKPSCQTKKNVIIFRQRLVRQIRGGWSDVSSDSGGTGKENGKGSYRLLYRRSDTVNVLYPVNLIHLFGSSLRTSLASREVFFWVTVFPKTGLRP